LSIEQVPSAEPGGVEQPAVAIKPILQRLLLRRERDGFLALDTLSSRVFKLDTQAGEFVQTVQAGATSDEAAKKLKIKKEDLEKFLSFLKEHEAGQRALGDG
jgi:hypothetical protein